MDEGGSTLFCILFHEGKLGCKHELLADYWEFRYPGSPISNPLLVLPDPLFATHH